MSKKIICGIILSILIVIIGLTFGISSIVKFVRMQAIIADVKKDVLKENYYLKIDATYKGKTSTTETFYRDGTGKLKSENGLYTWTDGEKAYAFMKEVAEEGKDILFVGTKKQAQECVKDAAIKSNMFYVDQRWLGGMLTNFKTIRKRIARLNKLEEMEQDGTFDVLPKKEVAALKNEMEKLEKNLGGIKNMTRMPGAMFVVDPKNERIAI